MKFEHLPGELIADVADRCDFFTAVNLSETCRKINQTANEYKFDKIDAEGIHFTNSPRFNELNVWINELKNYELNWPEIQDFSPTYKLPELLDGQEPHHRANEKTNQFIKTLSRVREIVFDDFTIDSNFTEILTNSSVNWKKVSARFDECSYKIAKEEVISFWKTFKTVRDSNGTFQESRIEFTNDEMIPLTWPNIEIFKSRYLDNKWLRNPRISDRTLEFLAKARPEYFEVGPFVANYTSNGINELFNKFVSSRDTSINHWHLGAVALSSEEYHQILIDFQAFRSDVSDILDFPPKLGFTTVCVTLKKKNSNCVGSVEIILIKPEDIATEQLNGTYREVVPCDV